MGIGLRIATLHSFKPDWSYDPASHWKYIEWFKNHWTLPDCFLSREAFQPPLYYFVAGVLSRWGLDPHRMGLLSVIAGCGRLLVIWLGVALYLPDRRLVRLCALAIAVVVPASIQVDEMIGGEAFSNLFCAIVIVLAPLVMRSATRRRGWVAAALGLALGLALISKVSALVIVVAILIAIAVESWRLRGSANELRSLVRAWAIALAITSVISGWSFARNYSRYQKPVITSFDCRERVPLGENIEKVPYLQRRPLRFYLGWSLAPYQSPYYPAGLKPPRFFPVLLAATFVDYYDFHFAHARSLHDGWGVFSRSPISRTAFKLSKLSFYGGNLIALAILLAWILAMRATWRQRRTDLFLLLLIPFAGIAGQLHFATKYPFDQLGHIKGTFIQFAVFPAWGLLGLAVDRLWEGGFWKRIAAGALLISIAAVAAYSLYCCIA